MVPLTFAVKPEDELAELLLELEEALLAVDELLDEDPVEDEVLDDVVLEDVVLEDVELEDVALEDALLDEELLEEELLLEDSLPELVEELEALEDELAEVSIGFDDPPPPPQALSSKATSAIPTAPFTFIFALLTFPVSGFVFCITPFFLYTTKKTIRLQA